MQSQGNQALGTAYSAQLLLGPAILQDAREHSGLSNLLGPKVDLRGRPVRQGFQQRVLAKDTCGHVLVDPLAGRSSSNRLR